MGLLSGFRNPHNLPVKACAHCGRPFCWRRKWARSWDDVKYCSKGCKHRAQKTPANICAAASVEDEF